MCPPSRSAERTHLRDTSWRLDAGALLHLRFATKRHGTGADISHVKSSDADLVAVSLDHGYHELRGKDRTTDSVIIAAKQVRGTDGTAAAVIDHQIRVKIRLIAGRDRELAGARRQIVVPQILIRLAIELADAAAMPRSIRGRLGVVKLGVAVENRQGIFAAIVFDVGRAQGAAHFDRLGDAGLVPFGVAAERIDAAHLIFAGLIVAPGLHLRRAASTSHRDTRVIGLVAGLACGTGITTGFARTAGGIAALGARTEQFVIAINGGVRARAAIAGIFSAGISVVAVRIVDTVWGANTHVARLVADLAGVAWVATRFTCSSGGIATLRTGAEQVIVAVNGRVRARTAITRVIRAGIAVVTLGIRGARFHGLAMAGQPCLGDGIGI